MVNLAISPICLAPISTMQNLVFSVQRNTVNGTPISVLKLPCVATVSPANERIELKYSLVVVFPCEPVMPITFNPLMWLRT